MTQLENILSHFKDLAYFLKESLPDDSAEYIEIFNILDKIEDGDITAISLIKDHKSNLNK